jgi:crotonobetainyl-CoA:carnitine CoA-transferase CaiB-like acyl-CoA transferase
VTVPGPLEGIRILDLTILINGPWATVMLADMGAEVIKVEDPVSPDPYRGDVHGGVDPRTGMHTYFETMNRGKRSIALNLKCAAGREVFQRLVRDADVVISNFRPGVMKRLGADYAALVPHNPRIITVTASGLGREGPDAEQGVVDLTGQSRSGYLSLTALEDGSPRYVGTYALADQVGAMLLAQGTLLAVLARERFGVGQDVDVSQLGSMLSLQALAFNNYLMMGAEPPVPRRDRPPNPLFNLYRARDGRWLSLACLQFARYWPGVCRALELDPVPASEDAAELTRCLSEAFARRDRDTWLERLRAEDVICAPVQSYPELARDPQVAANELLVELEHPQAGRVRQVGVPIKLARTPGAARTTAPEHGQHTEEILLASGYGWDDLAALRAAGAIG